MGWALAILPVVAFGLLAPLAARASGEGARTAGAAPRAADPAPAAIAGTYRMTATVRVAPGALPAQETEEHGDATVEPGSGPGLVRVRMAARGQRCLFEARLAGEGALAFAPGQRCRVVLDDEEAKGTVDATLAAGSGRARDGLLTLDLAFRVEGAVRLRPGSLDLLGAAIGARGLSAEVPISGEARARAEGRRDESRAAGR